MESETNMLDSTTFTELSQQLAVRFRSLLTEWATHGQISQESDQERLLAEFGRFRIWTEQTGAALRGRNSLDDTLQKDPQLRDSIIETFQQIEKLLRVATEMCSCSTKGISTYDPSEELLTSDSDYSEHTSISNEEIARSRPKVTKLSLVMSHIHEQIGLLYHHSVILRHLRIGGRYLYSGSIKDQSDVPSWELSHVQQKLERWDRSATQDSRTGIDVTTSDKPFESSPAVDIQLSLRLAAANNRRREQLNYWSQHPWMPEEQSKESLMPDDNTLSSPEPSESSSRSPSESTAPTDHTISSGSKPTVPKRDPEARPGRTVYANSELGESGGMTSKVPKVPVESIKGTEFECPYCHTALESSQMLNRDTWKRHVFRDLRPYTCTFSDCSYPEKLYATRRDWAYHEMQMHRRVWSCRLCAYTSTIKQDLADHLLEYHRGDCQPNQVYMLLEAGNGSMEESTSQECCFCHQQMSLRRLMDHMAAHLEDLALFVLPASNDDVPDYEESAAMASLDAGFEDLWQNAEPVLSGLDFVTQEPPAPLPKFESSTKTVQAMIESSEDYNFSPETVFTCANCNTAFDRLDNLKNHKSCHVRPYECPFSGCNQRFGRLVNLRKHTKTHTRPHKCPYSECVARFVESRDLERHKSSHHGEPGGGFHCPKPGCRYFEEGQAFSRKDHLKRHMDQMRHNTPEYYTGPQTVYKGSGDDDGL